MDIRPVRAVALMLLLLLQCASGSPQDRTIVKIAAERFTFTPSRVTVKRGTVIEFKLRSEDTNHGFKIVGSSANVIIPKRGRGEATLIFTADTSGRYTFECSKMCGAGHSFMRGEIVVEE
jgi:cytochrome c oxidase subunit 2